MENMAQAGLLEQVRKDIERENLLYPGVKIVVGVSGGADSVCLLKVLLELKKDYGTGLMAVHVNHGLRGEEADRDQEFVENLCRQWSVPLKTYFVNIRKLSEKLRISEEEAGRTARYRILENVLRKTGYDLVAVAHNMEDQAETVMMNILRGAGIDGLCGMPVKRGKIIRPLLNVSRREIEKYLRENNISFCIDSTNRGVEYTRNRIRNQLFPKIGELFGIDPVNQLVRLSRSASADRDYLEETAGRLYMEALVSESDGIVLSTEKLRNLPDAMVKRIIRIAWERINNSRKNLEAVHADQVTDLCRSGLTGKEIHLPCGFSASISYDRLILKKRGKNIIRPFSYPVEKEGRTVVTEANGALDSRVLTREEFVEKGWSVKNKESSNVQFFDLDKLGNDVVIRSRKAGDRIRPYSGKTGTQGFIAGEKKLKEFFIDKKIPAEERDRIPLVASGDRIAWIIGMRTSEEFRVREDTKNILMLKWHNIEKEGEQEYAEDQRIGTKGRNTEKNTGTGKKDI